MQGDREPVRNPKLRVMMAAIITAIVINSIIAVYAPTMLACTERCDIGGQSLILSGLIKFGELFPRIQAYIEIQEKGGFVYPWPALALSYGIFWLEFLVGVVVTWPLIVIDSIEWGRTNDFSKPLRPTQDPRTVISAAIAVSALGVWSMSISPFFGTDHHGLRTPSFSTNMLPAFGIPILYMLSNFLFSVAIRTRITSRKTRR